MNVEHKENYCIVKDTGHDLQSFLLQLTQEHKDFQQHNLIVDISLHGNVAVKEINAFLPLAKAHSKGKKSFVILADADFNKASDKLAIVPTLQEARDMIEMDEIERDLGF